MGIPKWKNNVSDTILISCALKINTKSYWSNAHWGYSVLFYQVGCVNSIQLFVAYCGGSIVQCACHADLFSYEWIAAYEYVCLYFLFFEINFRSVI